MWVSKAANSLYKVVRPVSRVLHSVGVTVLTMLMLFTGADVLLRYVFNRSIAGSVELTEFMMAILIGFGLAYCAVMDGHVRVDFIISRFSQKTQVVINSITGLLSLSLFSLVTWQLFIYVKEVYDIKKSSVVMLIPYFPFVAIVAVGCAVLTLVLLANFLKCISQKVEQ